MKPTSTSTSFLVVLLLAGWAEMANAQATIDVILDTGRVLGGGGGNPNNGGIFQSSLPPNAPIEEGGVTTQILPPFFSNQGPGVGTSQSVTYSSVDSATGATFNFDIVLTGYQNDNGTIAIAGLNDTGCCSVGVDSTFSGDDNDGIESDGNVGSAGQSEFLRVSVDNINVTDPGTLSEPLEFAGFFGATIRTQTGQGDVGDVVEAGDMDAVGSLVLASWDNNVNDDFRHFLDFGPTSAIDVVPTADQATLQGLRLRFQEAQAVAVPEPQAVAIWLMLGVVLAVYGASRRNKRPAIQDGNGR